MTVLDQLGLVAVDQGNNSVFFKRVFADAELQRLLNR